MRRGLIVLLVLASIPTYALSSTSPTQDVRPGTPQHPNLHFGAHAPAFTQHEAVVLHPSYRAALAKKHRHVGRDYIKQGRPHDGKVIWTKVIEQTQVYWTALHPNSDVAIDDYYRHTSDSWGTVLLTWKVDQLPPYEQTFLGCIADNEGGRGAPDVWFGGSTGWQRGRFKGTVTVVNHFQTRPYHAAKAVPSVAGRDAHVTYETFRILTWPRFAARVAVAVGHGAYVTAGGC